MDVAAPAWTGILCVMMFAIALAGIVVLFVMMRMPKGVATSHELAELREEVAQLREELERLKRTRPTSGSTEFKE